jgi:hypothetical protein
MAGRRAVLGFFAGAGAALVLTGAVAFACVAPARLGLNTSSGRPGDVITVSGALFIMPGGVTNGVRIYWNDIETAPLTEIRPDVQGNFSTTITVPDAPPGAYPVIAVLRDADDKDIAGSPARALFEIRTATAAPETAPAPVADNRAAAPVPAGGGSGSSFPVALVLGLGVLGLGLFAGGFVAVTRSRKAKSPSAAAVRRD